jgi:hypothetical protein
VIEASRIDCTTVRRHASLRQQTRAAYVAGVSFVIPDIRFVSQEP